MTRLQRIMGFGASSMQGACDSSGGGFLSRLAGWLAQQAPSVTVVNRGIGGNTTFDMVARLEADLAAVRPDLIIFSQGINDVPRITGAPRTTLEAYTANMRQIFQRTRACGATLYLGPFRTNCTQLGIDPAVLEAYLTTARNLARAQGLPIIDLYALIPVEELPAYWHTDGVHFNERGHAFIAGLLQEYIQQHYALPVDAHVK